MPPEFFGGWVIILSFSLVSFGQNSGCIEFMQSTVEIVPNFVNRLTVTGSAVALSTLMIPWRPVVVQIVPATLTDSALWSLNGSINTDLSLNLCGTWTGKMLSEYGRRQTVCLSVTQLCILLKLCDRAILFVCYSM